MNSRAASLLLAALTVLSAGAADAQGSGDRKSVSAQSQTGIGDAFKGFGSSTKDPIQIEADQLEVRDKENMAVFTGNVIARQKDTVLKTRVLKVFYEPKQPAGDGNAQAAGGNGGGTDSQKVRRYEAEGNVVITQADQMVTGDTGWFDMRSQKAQINNNVIVSQNKNVGTGGRVDVDLRTGLYTLSTPAGSATKGPARTTLIIEPNQAAGQPQGQQQGQAAKPN